MFNVQGSELIFLLLIALIVLGPEKLPDAVRKFGRTYAEFKKMANGFQGELKQALDEPLRELKGTADALRSAANFDLEDKPKSATGSAGATGSGATGADRPAAADLPRRPTPAVSEVPAGQVNFGGQRAAGLNFGVPTDSGSSGPGGATGPTGTAEPIIPTDGAAE